MSEQNFEYLKDNIKYMGFGEKQHGVLEQHLREGKETFQMTYNADVNKKPFEAVLQFRKSESSDMYFLNSYHASLEKSSGQKVSTILSQYMINRKSEMKASMATQLIVKTTPNIHYFGIAKPKS